MAPGDVLQGKRLPDVTWGEGSGATPPHLTETGDYWLVVDRVPSERELWFRDPAGHVGRVSKHTITVEDDGTITVAPSIGATTPDHGYDWHGFLEHGVWREV